MNIKYAAIVCMVMTFWFYGCSDQQDKFVVSIVIDDQCITENLTETEIVNTVREHFNFIQSYFTREFNIQLLQNNIKFISLTKEEGQGKSIIARPAGTDIFVVYMNNASHGGGGRTHLDAGNVFMHVSFEDKSVAQMNSYKWLLIHEIAHLFGALDVHWQDHVMDENSLFDGIGSEHYDLRDTPDDKNLVMDDNTKSIIRLMRKQMLEHGKEYLLENVDPAIAEDIIKLTNSLIPKATFPDRVLYRIAVYYFEQEQFQASMEYIDQGLELKSVTEDVIYHRDGWLHFNDFYYLKARCLEGLNEIEAAVAALNQINDDGPRVNEKYSFLGLHYINIGEQEKAVETYRKLTSEISPDYDSAWFTLGMVILENIPFEEWKGDEIEECKQAMLKTVELNSDRIEAHAVLGVIFQQQNQPDKSKYHLGRVTEIGLSQPLIIAKGGKSFVIQPPKKDKE